MFPRIFFIFFLILSPSFGSESEGPSETECRPYIEKALQREGATQETTPPIDDVGEPPQLSDSIDGSKEEAAGEEDASGSAESVLEPSDEVPISDESGTSSQEPPSEQLFTEELEQPASSEENVEPSGEQASNESTEVPDAILSDEPAPEASAESAEPSEEITESAEAVGENVGSEGVSQEATASAETVEDQSLEKTEETVSSEEEITAAEGSGEVTNTNDGLEVLQAPDADAPAELPMDVPAEEVPMVEESSSEGEIPSVEEAQSAEEPAADIESSEEPVQAEPQVTEDSNIDPTEPVASSEEASTEEELSSKGSEEVAAEEAPVEEPASIESVESESHSSAPDTAPETPVEEQAVPIVETETAPVVEDQPGGDGTPEAQEAASTDIPVAETEPEALPSETAPEPIPEADTSSQGQETPTASEESSAEIAKETEPQLPEEDLIMPIEIPSNLRTRDHMSQILGLAPGADEKENLLSKTEDNTLRELKKLYDAAIKPLEILYKYRDLSNRHFGDPEIFSKPLILFMGPWSGGKSTIINYLLENEFKRTALRSGAEPSPAYFNIVMHGDKEEILDGTQLAADWTFSGLQKFGQGLLDRLRGLRLNHPLLKKVNIVEIPGILEIRKQVERLFPFNDACQWFIDRADIIFLVYDPSKLDVGPETEAILDQLKGREMQTRIILNKADQVKPEELMRVQGTLIWNISPLMSSTEPPVMYSTSLWSLPYELGAPSRLLYAQECGFLKDLREAIDRRVENKIASARRFAVRVRNHAKMVDCYLTTYYNHKSFFGNKKKVSDDIIEHPQNYHIYEGLSTLTNISRYDLPDPDVYKDFFRLNPVYEFQQLAATCTYFRGCPINRLDVAIAYDLPELVGKYKKQSEELLTSRK